MGMAEPADQEEPGEDPDGSVTGADIEEAVVNGDLDTSDRSIGGWRVLGPA